MPRLSREAKAGHRRVLLGLALALTVVLVASGCLWPPGADVDPVVVATLGGGSVRGHVAGVVPDDPGDGVGVLVDRVYVQARARLAAGGAVEVGARVNATAAAWTPADRLFDYPNAEPGAWWTSSPIGPAAVGVSAVRIGARRVDGGVVELAVVTPDGVEVRPREPRLAHADLSAGEWSYTTPVVLQVDGEPAPSPGSEEATPLVRDLFVSASGRCGILPTGTIQCSGTDPTLPATLAGGPFVTISNGRGHTCAVHAGGEVACWGQDLIYTDNAPIVDAGLLRAPNGPFVTVSAGWQHTCGIRSDGTVACWGDDRYRQSVPPAGAFSAIDAGDTSTCGLRTDATASCWGGGAAAFGEPPGAEHAENVPSPPPKGAFVSIENSRQDLACGVRAGGEVDCWYPGRYWLDEYSPDSIPYPVRRIPPFDSAAADEPVDTENRSWSPTYDITHVPAGAFASVAVGGRHGCGLHDGGAVTCWGADHQHQSTPPGETFAAVTTGGYHTCALRADRGATCWGDDTVGQLAAPPGEFTALDAGWVHTCAIDADGTIACWGDDTSGQARPPAGAFAAISAGGRHTCAIDAAAEAVCWGDDTAAGQATPPAGAFSAITAGAWHTCGLRPDRTVECWGADGGGESTAPAGEFTAVAAGWGYTCALRPDRAATCWGARSYGYPPAGAPPAGPFVSLAAGSQVACGTRPDRTVECWIATDRRTIDASGPFPTTRAPAGTYRALSAGDAHTCAIGTDDSLACWGRNTQAQATPPPGAHRHVSAGDHHTCAIDSDARAVCWGENTFGQARAPAGRYATLSAGTFHTCATTTDGSLTCWGDDTYQQATPPDGAHLAVAAGERHTCALRHTGTIACWGDNTYEQTTPPPGRYTAITAGKLHTCARRAHDDHITCWGLGYDHDDTNPLDREPPATPPTGPFGAISAGTRHTCALDTRNHAHCWPQHGANGPGHPGFPYFDVSEWDAWNDSRADPLPGPFTAISAGTYHTCGIRPDGTIDCWSANEPRNR